MLTVNTRALYRRLLVLAVLCASLAFFLSTPATESAFTMGCLEDCDPLELQCLDGCPDDCAAGDASCSDCVMQCSQFRNWCYRTSTWCGSGGMEYEPRCSVEFGQHCEVIYGTCHQGYWQVCTTIVGNQPCIACPPNEICGGSSLPPC